MLHHRRKHDNLRREACIDTFKDVVQISGCLAHSSAQSHERFFPQSIDSLTLSREDLPSFLDQKDTPCSPGPCLKTCRDSVLTYASTVQSLEGSVDARSEQIEGINSLVSLPDMYETKVVPASPADFPNLFPSRRKLKIRHDDLTMDGNMNLRVDTNVFDTQGRRCETTLFHLRMHDLSTRKFSFRRYCRDSGREICSSTRAAQRPGLVKRSLSDALSSMRPSRPLLSKRSDSNSSYGSSHSAIRTARAPSQISQSTASINLEFSNYAIVQVSQSRNHSRFDFEYWDTKYCWREVDNAFQLTRNGDRKRVIARIVPAAMTEYQRAVERAKGGWIAPRSMWLDDDSVVNSSTDIAE